jgi:hypothetical protein
MPDYFWMPKSVTILVKIVGGWLSLMSGAISVIITAFALYFGGSEGFKLAIAAFVALWFIVIRTSWKNFQLVKIRPLGITPLEINYLSPNEFRSVSVGGSPTVNGIATSAAECNIEICNPNHCIDNVIFRLLELNPPMRAIFNDTSTNGCNLRGLEFPFNDITGRFLNEDQTGRICLFIAYRSMQGIDLSFGGEWKEQCYNRFEALKEYIFTVELSANGVPAKQHKFKATFSIDPTTPIFVLKELVTS